MFVTSRVTYQRQCTSRIARMRRLGDGVPAVSLVRWPARSSDGWVCGGPPGRPGRDLYDLPRAPRGATADAPRAGHSAHDERCGARPRAARRVGPPAQSRLWGDVGGAVATPLVAEMVGSADLHAKRGRMTIVEAVFVVRGIETTGSVSQETLFSTCIALGGSRIRSFPSWCARWLRTGERAARYHAARPTRRVNCDSYTRRISRRSWHGWRARPA